jgi:hypothetical protein
VAAVALGGKDRANVALKRNWISALLLLAECRHGSQSNAANDEQRDQDRSSRSLLVVHAVYRGSTRDSPTAYGCNAQHHPQ